MNESKDRLIELLDYGCNDYASYSTEMALSGNYGMESMGEFLAHKLLADGWMRPPCRVADKVQVLSKTLPTNAIDSADIPACYEGEVVSMRKNKHGCFFKVRIYARWTNDVFDYELGNYTESYMSPRCFNYPMSAIGKTVFLTREEAEKALRKDEGK